MNYDELLTKIDYYLIPTYKLSGNEAVKNSAIGFMQALRAVVELHKPIEDSPYCEHCCRSGFEYPCPTIQAIEKELN